MRPALLWDRLAEAGYRFRFFNEVVQTLEQQADGLSANRFRLRMANPRGFGLCMREEIRLHGPYLSLRARVRLGINYVRYSLHAGDGLARQYRDVGARGVWLASLLPGMLNWLTDQARMRSRARTG